MQSAYRNRGVAYFRLCNNNLAVNNLKTAAKFSDLAVNDLKTAAKFGDERAKNFLRKRGINGSIE